MNSLSRSQFLRSGLALGGLASMPLALKIACGRSQIDPVKSPSAGTSSAPPAQDRGAILAQAGAHEVLFSFTETLALKTGYELQAPYETSALEWVELVVDEPTRIELQHILVIPAEEFEEDGDTEQEGEGGPLVIKHWSQEWIWEDPTELTFVGPQRWQRTEVSEDLRSGSWTQRVTQVDDSPRYEARGRWRHENGISIWESEPTWRPLPRRDYSKRDDYQVMGCVNRHLVGPVGWVHEQENTKLILDGEKLTPLVRESGNNSYRRLDPEDPRFLPARESWQAHGERWMEVKRGWIQLYEAHEQVAFQFDDHGRQLSRGIDELVFDEQIPNSDLADRTQQFVETLLAESKP